MDRNVRVLTPVLIVATLIACDNGPTQPSSPRATGILVNGPAAIAPGGSAQYRAIVTFSTGTTEDVTAQATWRSTNNSILSVGSGGLATGNSIGEARVSAQYHGASGQASVFVLEPGTFRVSGRVTEAGNIGLPGARIAVVAGNGIGLSATTDPAGAYALYGLSGTVELEVVLDGFEKARQAVVVNQHSTANVELHPLVDPTDLRGDWQLTLTAATPCESVLAPDVWTRSYRVTLTQSGTSVHVQIKSPPIANGLSGRVLGSSVTITAPVDDSYYSYYGVRFYTFIETLSPGRFLGVGGTMRGERAGAAVTGTMDGDLSLYRNYDGRDGVWNRETICQRGDHAFRLDRN
jgi:hypothetical protein